MNAARLCIGGVMHARHEPVRHDLFYPLAYIRLPLSRLASAGNALFGVERSRLFSFRFRDHGARDGSHPLPWIRAQLARQGLDAVADGEVVLQTFPRFLGFVFNPVSFWFCHDAAGGLRAVLCEVNNTFGERHNYLVAHPDRRPMESGDCFRVAKVFHVSPFFPVRGEYVFRFESWSEGESVSIDLWQDGLRCLSTRIFGRGRDLDVAGLADVTLRFPFQSFRVVTRIGLHALRLWRKRVSIFPKPRPPLEETSS